MPSRVKEIFTTMQKTLKREATIDGSKKMHLDNLFERERDEMGQVGVDGISRVRTLSNKRK